MRLLLFSPASGGGGRGHDDAFQHGDDFDEAFFVSEAERLFDGFAFGLDVEVWGAVVGDELLDDDGDGPGGGFGFG